MYLFYPENKELFIFTNFFFTNPFILGSSSRLPLVENYFVSYLTFFIWKKKYCFFLKIFRFLCLWWVKICGVIIDICTLEVTLSIVSLESYVVSKWIWVDVGESLDKHVELILPLLWRLETSSSDSYLWFWWNGDVMRSVNFQ